MGVGSNSDSGRHTAGNPAGAGPPAGTAATPSAAGRAALVLPACLVLAGAVSVQSGAGIATRLFGQLPPATVTTLRLWSAALIMLLVAGRGTARAIADLASRKAWGDAVTPQAFARIPLGIAVTIEFLGPLAVTVTGTLTSGRHGAGGHPAEGRRAEGRRAEGRRAEGRRAVARRLLGLGYAALAAGGVVLLAGLAGPARLNWAGVAWAVASGTGWAGYIVASKATGQRLPGSAGLVVAMWVAALAVTAPGVTAGAPKMFRPSFLATGAGVGLLSSVIPYWLELEALRRVPARLFGVWMSVQPAVAALIGLALLGQRLSLAEWAGVCCVVAASAGAATNASPA